MQSRPPMPVTNQYEWCNKTRCKCTENQFEWQATWLHFGQVNSIDHKQVVRIHHDRAFVHVCAGLCFDLFFLFKSALCRNLCLSYALTSLPSLVCAELCSALVGFIHSCWLCSFHLRKSFILCIIIALFFPIVFVHLAEEFGKECLNSSVCCLRDRDRLFPDLFRHIMHGSPWETPWIFLHLLIICEDCDHLIGTDTG